MMKRLLIILTLLLLIPVSQAGLYETESVPLNISIIAIIEELIAGAGGAPTMKIPPIYNISSYCYTFVYPGMNLKCSFTVENKGDYAENITLRYKVYDENLTAIKESFTYLPMMPRETKIESIDILIPEGTSAGKYYVFSDLWKPDEILAMTERDFLVVEMGLGVWELSLISGLFLVPFFLSFYAQAKEQVRLEWLKKFSRFRRRK